MADNKVITSEMKGIPSFKGKFGKPDLGKINANIEETFKDIRKDARSFQEEMQGIRNLAKSINAYCEEHK